MLYHLWDLNPYGHCCPKDFLTTIVFTTNYAFYYAIHFIGAGVRHLLLIVCGLDFLLTILKCCNLQLACIFNKLLRVIPTLPTNCNFNLGFLCKVSAHCLFQQSRPFQSNPANQYCYLLRSRLCVF